MTKTACLCSGASPVKLQLQHALSVSKKPLAPNLTAEHVQGRQPGEDISTSLTRFGHCVARKRNKLRMLVT